MRYKDFVNKAVAACVSAIEVYNKPDFKYREETFSILMINAWELLLKGKILKDNPTNKKILYVTYPKTLKNGSKSKTQTLIKKTRSGNPMTIELTKALDLAASNKLNGINNAFKDNIEALCELRDCATHSYSDDPELSITILELGTASLRNFLTVCKSWFGYDLSKYNFFLMPLSFFTDIGEASIISVSNRPSEITNLLKFISERAKASPSNPRNEFNILLRIETKFAKSKTEPNLAEVVWRRSEPGDDPANTMPVEFTEEDIRARYPFTYKELTTQLKNRYSDFKQDPSFNIVMKGEIKSDKKYCWERKLHPGNPKSNATHFYSQACFLLFDKYYQKNEKR